MSSFSVQSRLLRWSEAAEPQHAASPASMLGAEGRRGAGLDDLLFLTDFAPRFALSWSPAAALGGPAAREAACFYSVHHNTVQSSCSHLFQKKYTLIFIFIFFFVPYNRIAVMKGFCFIAF